MTIGSISTSPENAVISSAPAMLRSDTEQAPGFSQALRTSLSSGSADLDAIFEDAALRYDISVDLLKAVAKAESNFRPDATSRSGAMGIMQLMPGTARALGVDDAYDPEQNIMGGASYLKQMLDRFGGDVSLALAAYNAGSNNVERYNGIPPFNETQNYVRTVLEYLGGDSITAGTVTYGGGAGMSVKAIGRSASTTRGPGTTTLSDAMTQMALLKIIEMQMGSPDDDEEPKIL